MTISASRLGSSPITLDWTNFISVSAKGSEARAGANLNPAWARLKARFTSGEIGFYDTPMDETLSAIRECEELASKLLGRQQFTDCLFLGIGGSSLGPLSLLSALEGRRQNRIRFHICENPDADDWKTTLAKLKPDTTIVCVVTKSGTTFETLSQFLLAMEWLGENRLTNHVVAITDPKEGDLRTFATQRGLLTLPIAPSIGGRFSVFTPVGLFAAALAGLSAQEFMLGARQVRDSIEKGSIEKNPIFILAQELIRHGKDRPIHVCMPYSTRLRPFGLWFVQLWGESLGKEGKGFTPLAALGATDQHSILQLLRDGPDDKVTGFITVDETSDPVKIPRSPVNLPAFKILEGHSLHDLLRYEYQATSLVLTRKGRPHFTLQLSKLDERNLGALYFAWSVLTAVTGSLLGINPFDQPGVEEGKVYIRKSLTDSRLALEEEDENSPVNRLRRHHRTETE